MLESGGAHANYFHLVVSLNCCRTCYRDGAGPPIDSVYPLNGDRARSILEESLKDKNPDTRKQAVQALGLVGPREPYVSEIELMLDDKDLEVRLAAITSMVELKNKQTVPALTKELNDDVPEVSFAAAKALWTLNEPSGREALISVLSGDTKIASGWLTKQKRETLQDAPHAQDDVLVCGEDRRWFRARSGIGVGISSLQGILLDANVSGRAATALLLAPTKIRRVASASGCPGR